MTSSQELARRLAEAGAPPEAIAIAVQILIENENGAVTTVTKRNVTRNETERNVTEKRHARPLTGAQRSQRHRDKLRAVKAVTERDERNVSRYAEKQGDIYLLTSSSLESKKESPKEERKKRKKDSIEDTRASGELFGDQELGKKISWPADALDQFWAVYPRRVAKANAERALSKIRRAGKVEFSTIIAGADRYAQFARSSEPQFIKHPATWLNGGCWADELMPTVSVLNGGNNGRRKQTVSELAFEMADEIREREGAGNAGRTDWDL